MTTRNIANRHAGLDRLGQEGELQLRRETPMKGDTGNDNSFRDKPTGSASKPFTIIARGDYIPYHC